MLKMDGLKSWQIIFDGTIRWIFLWMEKEHSEKSFTENVDVHLYMRTVQRTC